MSKKHQAQHRERREEAKGKELAETKKENQQLKRQVARLSKQLSRALVEQTEEDETPTTRLGDQIKCEPCQSTNLKSVKMPTGILTVCQECGWRKKR